MVGQGLLRECLFDPEADSILTVGRNATVQQHEKQHEIVHNDLSDPAAIEGRLPGYDACFFCLGVSAAGMDEEEYRHVTYDLSG
jgi:putative NADH-flavin reductase